MKHNKLSDKLSALALVAGLSCWDTYNNAYYGPNGEEISDSSGSACIDSPLRGKYLIQIGACDISTKQPLADNCTGQMYDKDNPEPYLQFTYSGLSIRGGFTNKDGNWVDASFTLIRPESKCVISNNKDLYFKQSVGDQTVKTRLENLMQVGTAPYPGHFQCKENYQQNPRYH